MTTSSRIAPPHSVSSADIPGDSLESRIAAAVSRERVRQGGTYGRSPPGNVVAVSLIVAAPLVVPVPAYPMDNVLGWQNTRWGMTESEVKGSVESSGLRFVSLAGPDGRPLDAGSPFRTNIQARLRGS